jgi:hypothetical protein
VDDDNKVKIVNIGSVEAIKSVVDKHRHVARIQNMGMKSLRVLIEG